MKQIAEFLFEAHTLKRTLRTGYNFLGTGRESVAEHTFVVIMIAWVMSQMEPKTKENNLILMCLMHDLPETRIGDLNYVQQKYVKINTSKLDSIIKKYPFGTKIKNIIEEFNNQETLESKLANDADQLAFMIDLKYLAETGHPHTLKWIKNIKKRIKTSVGLSLFEELLKTNIDAWWNKIFIDNEALKNT